MDMSYPVADAQRLYEQWQDGQLLDSEERKALRPVDTPDLRRGSFADFLKNASKLDA
jgi:hypothetical protein